MWGKSNNHHSNKLQSDTSEYTTLIAPGTEVSGDVSYYGAMHLEGCIKGNVNSEQGVLTITENGAVEGDICVSRIVINGHVTGNVHAIEHLELESRAVIHGNVYYNLLEMAEGAQVNGSLEHKENGRTEATPLLISNAEERMEDNESS